MANSKIIIAYRNHHSKKYDFKGLDIHFLSAYGYLGRDFLKHINKVFLKKVFPECAKIVIDQWTGSYRYFYISICNEEGKAIARIKAERGYACNDCVYEFSLEGECGKSKMFADTINDYNEKEYKKLCKTAGLSLAKNANNFVNVVYHDKNESTKVVTLNGSVFEIIDCFVTMNDRLKYINGCYYAFESKYVDDVYRHFIKHYKGNFFLDNAVRRGCIID